MSPLLCYTKCPNNIFILFYLIFWYFADLFLSYFRSFFGNLNFFGGHSATSVKSSSKLQQIEQDNSDAMFIVLSDVWLDQIRVRLEKNLSEKISPSNHIIIISTKSWTSFQYFLNRHDFFCFKMEFRWSFSDFFCFTFSKFLGIRMFFNFIPMFGILHYMYISVTQNLMANVIPIFQWVPLHN